MPQTLLAASDVVLASACLFAASRLPRDRSAPLIRAATLGSIALIGAAAVVGAIRFGGWEILGPAHRFLSDQSAIVAMPVLALALFAQRTGMASSGTSLQLRIGGGIAAIALLVVAVWQERMAAALLSLAILAALIAVQPRRALAPAVLLAGLVLAGAARTWTRLDLDVRLITLHLILAGWIGAYVRALGTGSR